MRFYHLGVRMAGGMPAPPTPLVGRADELAAVRGLLVAPGARLVTITGPPGVGKTRLAVSAASGVADRFEDDVLWVDLSAVRDHSLLVPEISAAIDHRRGTGGEVLVVLDNCEHLLDAMPGLGELLADTARLRVLATSRERLRLAAEQEFALAPLSMPVADEIADLGRLRNNASIALLLARSPASVSLTQQTAQSLAELCIRLDGLPLAIELAAARLRVFTPAELAFRLGRRMDVLTSSVRDSPARHQDLRSALSWSHDLLPDSERRVFRRLSVMVGDWTLEAALAVCGDGDGDVDVTAAIESLVDKSLVYRVGADTAVARFRMLASICEFAAEQLVAQGEVSDAQRRHAAYFADEARRYESTVGTERETDGWHELGFVHADLRAAFALDVAADPDAVLWLSSALAWYAHTRGMLAGCGPVVEAIHARLDDCRDEQAAMAALIAAGVVEWGSGDIASAERDLARAIGLAERRDDARREAVSSAFLGHVGRVLRRFDDAAARYAAARDVYERLGHVRGTAWAAYDLGLLALVRGQLGGAESSMRQALSLFRDVEYDWATAVTVCALADVVSAAGAVDEAAVLYGEALALHERLGDQRGVAQAIEGLAHVSLTCGAAATAARLHGAALTLRQALGAVPGDWEQQRGDRLEVLLAEALGRAGAEREARAGRALPSRSAILLAVEAATAAGPRSGMPVVGLTARQLEVAALVAAGATNRQLARRLGISEKTVEVHVRNIMERLQTPSRAGIASWATAHGVRPAVSD